MSDHVTAAIYHMLCMDIVMMSSSSRSQLDHFITSRVLDNVQTAVFMYGVC